jgi:acetyl/propionyl-CoA carboxylase alpha subunit
VAAAGLVFVGPSPETLAAVGEKTEARRRMSRAGVQVVPGSAGVVATVADALRAARDVGFPVLLKPAAGGGGKGMRLASDAAGLEREFAAAAREAEKAFADPSLYVERFLGRVRHLEVQILGTTGGTIALGERECSIQRRHQKLVEESPAPAVGPWGVEREDLRRRLVDAAVRAGDAVGYRNAGTVEFLLDARGEIHFIEVNARLQVEHPVTEVVTGLDLVEAQLRIAACEELPAAFAAPRPSGWAIEVRVCAEDPARGFLPATGTVRSLRLPGGPGVRWDGGLEEGMVVTPIYDSLLGKLIVHAPDRPSAVARLTAALDELRIEGLTTNLPFLRRLVRLAAFGAGDLHTGFVDQHARDLAPPGPADPARLAVAAAWEAARSADFTSAVTPARSNGRLSAWRAERPGFVWVP